MLNKFTTYTLFTLLLSSLCFADTIYFNNGAVLEGKIQERNTQTVTVNVEGKNTTYSMKDIKDIKTLEISAPPPAVAVAPAPAQKQATQLTLTAGTAIHIITRSSLNTKSHKAGHQFKATLDSDLTANNKVIAPKGSDVYGVVSSSNQAGRLAGKSDMIIELTAISINNKRISIHTNKINAVAQHSQAKNTVGKVARGAAIGGLINRSKGARDGAKVGLGAAVLTRGEAISIPANTLLDFTISSNVNIVN